MTTDTNTAAITPRAPGLPNLRLLRHLIRLDEDGNLFWTATGSPATVPHSMSRQPLVALGFFVIDAEDVREALTFGAWPDGAASRGLTTRHVSHSDWLRAVSLMQENSDALERAAALEGAA